MGERLANSASQVLLLPTSQPMMSRRCAKDDPEEGNSPGKGVCGAAQKGLVPDKTESVGKYNR